jgi:3-oxoacyl-[acyl-carrier protein] reductase
MITATKTMAVELAPEGIRVNALCPVAGETPLLKSIHGRGHAGDAGEVPLHHPARPLLHALQDMGEAAAFLCSDAASMITGAALEVDGGRCI